MWEKRHRRYGPVSWFRAFGTTIVALLGPEASGVVLQNRDKAFANGEAWQFLIGPFFDRGLMLLDFDEHMAHRRLMQEAFTSDRLARYAAAIDPAVRTAVEQWQPGERVEVYPRLKQLTLNLAVEVFMGGAPGASQARLDQINAAFIDCVQAATALVRYPVPGGRWHRGLVGRRRVEGFLRDYLPAKRAGDGDEFSVLCRVEADGERFSDDDVINHTIFLLMAAHDTSTITISTMMQYLGQHPEWQERCREESLAIPRDTISCDQLSQLGSLDLVMKESLRLVSPVPTIAPRPSRTPRCWGTSSRRGRWWRSLPTSPTTSSSTGPIRRSSTPAGSPRSAGRTRSTARRGSRSAAACTSASACTSPAPRSHSCCITCCARSSGTSTRTTRRRWKSLPFPKDGQPIRLVRRTGNSENSQPQG